MFAILLLGVLIALLVLSVLALFVFVDVAFADPAKAYGSVRQWQPPFMCGKELRSWAARMAYSATNKWLAKARSKTTAVSLAAEVSEGASYAIAQSQTTLPQLAPHCPSCRQHRIGVTPPEALAIAATIRSTLSKHQVRRIREQLAQNAESLAGLSPDQYEQSNITCPLWDGESSCLAFKARPLHCRSWRPESAEDVGAEHQDAHAATVGCGAEDGLSNGLQAAGLDGTVYELNSALAAALDLPVAAEQWARGNTVFEQCTVQPH
jgi:hypothetical protein